MKKSYGSKRLVAEAVYKINGAHTLVLEVDPKLFGLRKATFAPATV